MSPLYRVERSIEIDAAHRATFDGSKCSNLHGHRYHVIVACVGPMIEEGPQQGMVMDFGILKKLMMEEIDAPCDHATLLWIDDPSAQGFVNDPALLEGTIRPQVKSCGFYRLNTKLTGALYLMDCIPTAEGLAAHWYARLKPRIEAITTGKPQLKEVRVFESANCMAAYPA